MKRSRLLIAPDSFKGQQSARQVAAAIASLVQSMGYGADVCPLADGGEGTLDAVAHPGDKITVVQAAGADGATPVPVRLQWPSDTDAPRTARFECADIVGHAAGRGDARGRTSRGVGEVIRAAVHAGAARIVVGLGGSSTVDMGRGLLEALDVDVSGRGPIDLGPARQHLRETELIAWCDVALAASGTPGVEAFFAQKGVPPDAMASHRQACLALAARYGGHVASAPHSAAAGGIAAALLALGARLEAGAMAVMHNVGFAARLAAADGVITGEGAFDATSRTGKITGHVLEAAMRSGVPAVLVCGTAPEAPVPAVALRFRDLDHPAVRAEVRALVENTRWGR